jgi:hypothetical protein
MISPLKMEFPSPLLYSPKFLKLSSNFGKRKAHNLCMISVFLMPKKKKKKKRNKMKIKKING